MATPEDVVAVARREIGYVEQHPNRTKYWQELLPSFQGQPWCAAFVSWCFKHAGAPLPAMPWKFGYTYVGACTDAARKNGWVITEPRPGAIVNFGNAHTELCTSFADAAGNFRTVGGNTSSGTSGSQSNGGGVYDRTRNTNGSGIGPCTFVWPPVFTNTPAPTTPTEDNDVAVFITTDGEGLFVTNGVAKAWVRNEDHRHALLNTKVVGSDHVFGLPKPAFEAIPTQAGGGAPTGSTAGK